MTRCVSTNLAYLKSTHVNNVRYNLDITDVIIISLCKQDQSGHSFLDFLSSPKILFMVYAFVWNCNTYVCQARKNQF